ncbi:hypothetical protein E4T42_08098 [Aureobasidium subglaciale]|nr:hypothetical protein E4T42_08098 [Aureobasidium subglaciale]
MPSPYSDDKKKLYGHQRHRDECLSQRISNTKNLKECIELGEDKKQKKQQVEEGNELIQSFKDAISSLKKEIEVICAGNQLSQAFEQDAAERQVTRNTIWHEEAARSMEKAEIPKLNNPDSSCPRSFKGLDRPKIETIPSYLLREFSGLLVWLRLRSRVQNDHPMDAIDKACGPANMNHDSVIGSFGPPSEPDDDWPSDTTAPASPKAELHLKKVSETKQWELLGSSKFLEYADLLVPQYAKLVTDKVAEDKKKEEKQFGQPSNDDLEIGRGSKRERLASGTRPYLALVHQLDSGLQGSRPGILRDHTPKVGTGSSKAIAAVFDPGNADFKPPTTYYHKARSIRDLDAEEYGLSSESDLDTAPIDPR